MLVKLSTLYSDAENILPADEWQQLTPQVLQQKLSNWRIQQAANRPETPVYLSHSPEDWEKVEALAKLLDADGWNVSLELESSYPPEQPAPSLEDEIREFSCVIVCWSQSATFSKNVITESGEAKNQQKLVQILLKPESNFGESVLDLPIFSSEWPTYNFSSLSTAASWSDFHNAS